MPRYGGPVLIKQSFDSARHLATAPKSIKDIGPMVKHVMEVRMEELAKTAAIRNITVSCAQDETKFLTRAEK